MIASHPELTQDAVLWFARLQGVRGPAFSLHEEVMESGAGFYLFVHSALEDVKLELCLEQERWRLELSCALFSMGNSTHKFKVSTDLDLCDDFDLQCA